MYLMNRILFHVWDLWREWTVGIGNGPAVSKLNEDYGSGWRTGWPQKERQYYSQRVAIIDHILCRAKAKVDRERLTTDEEKAKCIDEMARQVDREQGKFSLNAMANKIRKEAKVKTVKNQR